MEGPEKPGSIKAQCLPLFSLLLALNVTSLDYFSLDVEGNELDVLRTIPFDSVHIKVGQRSEPYQVNMYHTAKFLLLFTQVLSVEYIHNVEGREGVRKYMRGQGFTVFGEVTDPVHGWANDWIFINRNLQMD